jgi:C1A family cysteine protease
MTIFGWLRDLPDPKDFSFSSLFDQNMRAKVRLASGDVDLRPFTTPSNQYNIGSCAGNATADSVEILNAIEGKPRVELSRLFVYSMARTLHQALAKDEGTYIRTCFKVLSTFGICEETVWPYDTRKVFVSPSLTAQRRALGHKIHSFYRISSTGQDRIDDVAKALRLRKPVVFGTLVDQAFVDLRNFNPMSEPRGKTLGGHAMIVVGIQDGNFIVKNSWGTGWGQKGFWLMKPSYLAWKNTHDLWVPTLGVEFR